MKLFHTSDWHLGRMLYGRSLLEDQRWFLQQVFLPAVERERPACVLIAGDVYDRQIAPVEAIQLFDETLAKLLELGTTVCVISGNHDGAGRMALLKSALRRSGAIFATTLEDAFSPVELRKTGNGCSCSSCPTLTPPKPGISWGTTASGGRAPAPSPAGASAAPVPARGGTRAGIPLLCGGKPGVRLGNHPVCGGQRPSAHLRLRPL